MGWIPRKLVNGFLLLLSYYLPTLTTILLPHTRFSKLQQQWTLKSPDSVQLFRKLRIFDWVSTNNEIQLIRCLIFYLQTLTTILLSHTRFSKLQQQWTPKSPDSVQLFRKLRLFDGVSTNNEIQLIRCLIFYLQTLTTILLSHTRFSKLQQQWTPKSPDSVQLFRKLRLFDGVSTNNEIQLIRCLIFYLHTLTTILLSHTRFSKLQQQWTLKSPDSI